MEAVATGAVASPALCHQVLGIFGGVDTWASDPAGDAITTLVNSVADGEVPLLPQAIGAVLPLLVGAPDRFSVALDAVLRFDLYEAAPGLAALVWRGMREATLAGAALAARPDVDPEFSDLVRAHRSDLTEDWQRDLFLTRLEPSHGPRSDSARADRWVRWPADQPMSSPFVFAGVQPPGGGFGWRDHFRLVLDLVASGTVVRRLSEASRGYVGPWLPKWVPVIGPDPRDPTFRVTHTLSERQSQQLVQRVLKLGPTPTRLVQPARSPELIAPAAITDIEVFDDGAMPRAEVAYLAGLRAGQFENLRRYANLTPTQYRGFNYWTFAQVVGLRAARYLFALSGRRQGLTDVADRLVRVARQERVVPVAVTEKGEVVIKDGDNLYDVQTGQGVQEETLVYVDRVYQPFELTGGTVPRLLNPTAHTAVHPGVVAGLPCVESTRVSVGAISRALAATRAAGNATPANAVAEAFGLHVEQVEDAERVANDMQAAVAA